MPTVSGRPGPRHGREMFGRGIGTSDFEQSSDASRASALAGASGTKRTTGRTTGGRRRHLAFVQRALFCRRGSAGSRHLRVRSLALEDTLPTGLSNQERHRLAKLGAAARLAEIQQEREALTALMNGTSRAARSRSATPGRRVTRLRRRSRWSAAQRKAVSARMKKYWAARRAGRKK
jgi:hypothetical protein